MKQAASRLALGGLLSYYGIVIICPLDDDLLFTDANFTLSKDNRICFDAIVIDDDVVEYTKYYGFNVRLQNRTFHEHFYDYTQIIVTDNEGWFSSSYEITPGFTDSCM